MFRGSGSHKTITRILKGPSPQPIRYLQRQKPGPNGEKIGTYTTEEGEIDEILIDEWKSVFDGNVKSIDDVVKRFMGKYDKYIFRAPEFKIKKIDAAGLRQACSKGLEAGGGLDTWTTKEVGLLSDLALQLLADMFNKIEEGATWPACMQDTRAVFLNKDPEDVGNPMAYRILKITSTLYRKWASTRLSDLQEWVQTWADEAMHAGIPGVGAEDAWYITALDLEQLRLHNVQVSGGSIDVFKCFDQILRPLVIELARQAGMPNGVLDAYTRYIEGMNVHFQVGCTIGRGHKDKCSIPQGCPFSMTLVALLMRPWIAMMKEHGLVPRTLADDLLLYAYGPKHCCKYVEGMKLSRQYFEDIGARVADKKCFSFSTCQSSRAFLKKYKWGSEGFHIPVVNSFRDLGAHLNLTHSRAAPTTTKRLRIARDMVRRLRRLPLGHCQKLRVIRSNALTAALYGSEVAPINVAAMRSFRAAVADTLGPRSKKRSAAIVFSVSSGHNDVDPEVQQVVRKIAMLRRMMDKHPEMVGRVQNMVGKYGKLKYKGTYCGRDACTEMRFAPPLGTPERRKWKETKELFGPVGLLLQELHYIGAIIDSGLQIHQEGEIPFDLMNTPWQFVKQLATQMAVRARTHAASGSRESLGGVEEIDVITLQASYHRFADSEKRILTHMASGAAWSGEEKKEIGRLDDARCPHCGAEEVNIVHTVWHCPEIHKHRKRRDLCQLDVRDIPSALQLGLPEMMSQYVSGTYWGLKSDDMHTADRDARLMMGLSKDKKVAEAKDMQIQQTLAKYCAAGEVRTQNARQVFQHIRGPNLKGSMELPKWCEDAAPQGINVYTDGSWKNPLRQYWGLGGAGVWWPGRDLSERQLSEAEYILGVTRQEENGVAMKTVTGGYGGSSTRTELAAGILALMYNGPVHIGTDSSAFLMKARVLMQMVEAKKKPKRPWGSQTDGDLWEHFYKSVAAKNPVTVAISKVKGHATHNDVLECKVEERDWIGNSKADELANEGVQVHGQDEVQIAALFTNRHRWYARFVHKVHVHMVEAYKIDAALKESKSRDALVGKGKKRKRPGVLVEDLKYGDVEKARKFRKMAQITDFGDFVNKNQAARDVAQFLGDVVFEAVDSRDEGTSWLELYTVYRMKGGQKPVPDGTNRAARRATLGMQLRRFKQIVRGLRERIVDARDAEHLRASLSKWPRLRSVGVDNHVPSLRMRICIDRDMARRLMEAVIRSQRRMKARDVMNIISKTQPIVPQHFNLKGGVAWDNQIKMYDKKGWCEVQRGNGELEVGQHADARRVQENANLVFFHCPKCPHKIAAQNRGFQEGQLDKLVWCKGCRLGVPSRKWKCPCGQKWFLCGKHRSSPKMLQERKREEHEVKMRQATRKFQKGRAFVKSTSLCKRSKAKERKMKKKTVPEESMISFDRPAAMTINPSCLSAGLKRKFAHLLV